jgi:acyl dehydratase
MPARKLYFESVRVGDELPALAKAPLDRVQLVRYAGAAGDFNPIHIDDTFAKSIGMPSVYAPGMLVMGFLGQLVSDWARGAQLRRYHVRFIKIVWPGDTVVCKGRVTDRFGENGRYFAEVDLWAENQKGELVMKGQCNIQLFYSLEDENRQRAGQPPIIVEAPRESILTAQLLSPEPPRVAQQQSAGADAKASAAAADAKKNDAKAAPKKSAPPAKAAAGAKGKKK